MAKWVISYEILSMLPGGDGIQDTYYFTGRDQTGKAWQSTLDHAKVFSKKADAAEEAKNLVDVELVKLT